MVDAYVLDDEVRIDKETVSLRIIVEKEEPEAKYLKDSRDGRKLQVEFKVGSNMDKILVVNSIMMAILNLKLEDLNETLSYPFLLQL